MGRAPCCEKIGLKKGRWTVEEDEILTKYIQAHGEGSWRSLPKSAGLLRCGKSCRLRWINYLRADLKRGNISKEEEQLIVKLHASLGNRWSLIASYLPGRTDNEIKNYWNSHLSRKVHNFGRSLGNIETQPLIMNVATKLKEGRTTRYATKKTVNKGRPATTRNDTYNETTILLFQHARSALDKERETKFSSAINNIDDSVNILDPCPCAEDKEQMDLVMPSAYQEIGIGGMLLGSNEEKERQQVLSPSEATSGNSIMCASGNGGDKESEILGPYQRTESEMLLFNDVMENDLLDRKVGSTLNKGAGETLVKNEDRDQTDNLSSSNGDNQSHVWYSSCSSITSCFDDCGVAWAWEDWVPEGGHDHNLWGEREEHVLSWLWEGDNGEGAISNKVVEDQVMGYYDDAKKNAMVAWLLS